jgi:hypothetical protein
MWLKQLEKEEQFDDLPSWESRAAFNVRVHGYVDLYRHYYRPNPYVVADRILKNNIGKSFDLAFSYYCKKVRKFHQEIFLNKVKSKKSHHYFFPVYSVDDSGRIAVSTQNIGRKLQNPRWKQGLSYWERAELRKWKEKQKKKKRLERLSKKLSKMTEEQFRTILAKRKLSDRHVNTQRIIAHGFDPIMSFRSRKQP